MLLFPPSEFEPPLVLLVPPLPVSPPALLLPPLPVLSFEELEQATLITAMAMQAREMKRVRWLRRAGETTALNMQWLRYSVHAE